MLNRSAAPVKENAVIVGQVDGKDIFNCSYVGGEKTELVFDDDDYASFRRIVKQCCTDQGVKPMSKEELAKEREMDMELVKKFTKAIFSMDLSRFSFPVGYSEQRSFLERTADIFSFIASIYAGQMVDSGIPEMRLQYLATGIIAGFHLYMASKKPWNPVLGETYIARWPNGVTLYGEQTSHHPPVSDFQIFGPDNSWKCSAHCNFSIKTGFTQVDIGQNGVFELELDDGTVYKWQFPDISVLGLISGERYVVVRGPLVVEDVTNKMKLVVDIAPKPDKSKGIVKQRQTQIYGGILDMDEKGYTSRITGDYCKSLAVDGEEVWNIENDFAHRPIEEIPADELLLSDSRFRLDRMYFIKGDLATADIAKRVIEDAQRREEKQRQCVAPA